MKYDAIIIGGGLAGLSAAIELTAHGRSVLLLEQAPHPGGRAFSFTDAVTGNSVDNGQHLMMGCYHATRQFLRTIGSDQRVHLQPNLRIEYLFPDGGSALFQCAALPPPLNFLSGLLRLQSLTIRERSEVLRVGLVLQQPPEIIEPFLRTLTVEEWLKKLGQSDAVRLRFWNIIAIGALNNTPATASALLFYRVLRTIFSGDANNASLMIPTVGLSELFSLPALQTLRLRQAHVMMGMRVIQLLIDHGTIMGVRCANGRVFVGAAVIAAVPPLALQKLLAGSESPLPVLADTLGFFHSSSILSVNLWFQQEVMQQEFCALLDSPIHWIFNRTLIHRFQKQIPQQLSLVISAADEFIDLEKQHLLTLILHELQRYFPRSVEANLLHSVIIKEKRATFLQTPAVESLRPQAITPFSNFVLAGDWTDTGYPATIEGAVLSGVKAARVVIDADRV